jgi:hypothetical protein
MGIFASRLPIDLSQKFLKDLDERARFGEAGQKA